MSHNTLTSLVGPTSMRFTNPIQCVPSFEIRFRNATMTALVSAGVGKIELEDIPKPRVEKPTGALVKISRTTLDLEGGDQVGMMMPSAGCLPGESA